MKYIIHPFILFAVFALLISCKDKTEEEAGNAAPKDEISIEKAQLNLTDIELGKARMEVLHRETPARGKVTLPPDHLAMVNAYFDGVISKVNVIPGEKVRAGKVLAEYNSPDIITIQELMLKSHHSLPMLKARMDRQAELSGQGISAEKAFEEAKSEYMVEKANYEGLQARIGLMGISTDKLLLDGTISPARILSPINGTINTVEAHPGMSTEPGQMLFEIVDNKDLLLNLWVLERDIPFVEVGQEAVIHFGNVDIADITGKVSTIGSRVDEESRTIPVMVEFDASDLNVLPGMFVSCIIRSGEQMFYVLPESAVVLDSEGQPLIFYTTNSLEDELITFNWMPVETGVSSQGKVEIMSELYLPSGAQIVTKGGYYLLGERWKNEEE
jgi:cobalt-zinc-cadmium efflux system membrane fusion protein